MSSLVQTIYCKFGIREIFGSGRIIHWSREVLNLFEHQESSHSRYHKKIGRSKKGEEKGEETGPHWLYLDGDAVWYKTLEDELVNFTLSPAC